jgi:hypothetical protein
MQTIDVKAMTAPNECRSPQDGTKVAEGDDPVQRGLLEEGHDVAQGQKCRVHEREDRCEQDHQKYEN